MTTQTLAILILLAILFQVGLFSIVAFFRHWGEYRALQERLAVMAPAPLPAAHPISTGPEPVSWEGLRPFRVARRVKEAADGSICSFELKPVDGAPLPEFRPGQFLTFRLEVADPGGGPPRMIVRCYSLSDAFRPDQYRISIKRVPPPADRPELPSGVSSNHFHDYVQEGAILSVRAPSGRFHLTDEPGVPLVLVGGGIGITPMLSILNTVVPLGREAWLFYGVRSGAEAIQLDHLRALAAAHANFHLHLCYSAPNGNEREGVDFHHKGHVDIRLLRLTLPLRRHQFYVCGPRPMMEALIPALEAWGVAPGDCLYESFGPASLAHHERPPTAPQPVSVQVHFRKSGRTVTWDAKAGSLLEFAEAQGVAMDSGCRAGSCGCCRTGLVTGEVEYAQDPDAGVVAGTCLPCICTPTTDLTLDV